MSRKDLAALAAKSSGCAWYSWSSLLYSAGAWIDRHAQCCEQYHIYQTFTANNDVKDQERPTIFFTGNVLKWISNECLFRCCMIPSLMCPFMICMQAWCVSNGCMNIENYIIRSKDTIHPDVRTRPRRCCLSWSWKGAAQVAHSGKPWMVFWFCCAGGPDRVSRQKLGLTEASRILIKLPVSYTET